MAEAPNDVIMRDAEQKTRSFAGLSRQYAAQGHAWLALHAQAASDLAAAHYATLSTGVDSWDRAPLTEALAAMDIEGCDASQAIFHTRREIGESLTDDAFALWRDTTATTHHLNGLGTVTCDTFRQALEARFADLAVEEYLWRRTQEAQQADDEARTTLDTVMAIRRHYDGDVAAYESWLIRRSLALGDFPLTQYELLWALGMAAIGGLPALPEDALTARQMVLSRLAWALGPEEALEFVAFALRPVG